MTPTADEHSIKVEGAGSATITDITVELLPNRDIFQEIYPDSDSEAESDEPEEDTDAEAKVDAALEGVREELVTLADEQKRAKEIIASAESRLKILDSYGNSLERKCGVDIEASVETYRQEREKVFKDHMDGAARDRALTKQVAKLIREKVRLEKLQAKEEQKAAKEKAKTRRAKAKLEEKKRRRDEEKMKEKARIRKEREQFWPRSCYTIRISLDAGASFTPGSSRRSSIASATDVQLASAKGPKEDDTTVGMTCDLTLSYVTSSAFWAPSYDLALSSTTNTAMLSFDARLTNMTSETWANSKVTLSTSQASFSGLQDDIPTLVPWRLEVVSRGGAWDGSGIVHSREERYQKEAWNAAQNAMVENKPRAALFGVNQMPQQAVKFASQPQASGFGVPQASGFGVPQAQPSLFGASAKVDKKANNTSLFGGQMKPAMATTQAFGSVTNTTNVAPGYGGGLFGSAPMASRTAPEQRAQASEGDGRADHFRRGNSPGEIEEYAADDADGQTILDPTPEVTFQESAFEETGLTATYDLPHLKTLKPSSTASKQRVARVSFTHVAFSRTVVAKYKPAAYLRARLRNTSKLTLLKGPTGLTLDGTFLGRSTLPRCSAGDSFSIPLGVDPAIRVAYPKPDVTRSTTGVFSNRENSVYTRSVTLVNTRASAGKTVSVTVLDQVPVSEDEKIRVDVLHPAGIQAGKTVAAGVPGKEGKEELDWGRATASLKKAGEVQWEVVLNAGKSVKLMLQYEVAFPTGERVTQAF